MSSEKRSLHDSSGKRKEESCPFAPSFNSTNHCSVGSRPWRLFSSDYPVLALLLSYCANSGSGASVFWFPKLGESNATITRRTGLFLNQRITTTRNSVRFARSFESTLGLAISCRLWGLLPFGYIYLKLLSSQHHEPNLGADIFSQLNPRAE